MNCKNSDKEMMEEFILFVEADPVLPKAQTDRIVCKRVEKSLNPPLWSVFAKFAGIQALAGLASLLVCPQFTIGFKNHSSLFHSLHSTTPSFLYFLMCGIFFVLLGAGLAGLILSRDEIRAIKKARYIYYIAYSMAAHMTFVFLGAEVIVSSSTAWIIGAAAGSYAGFESAARIKQYRGIRSFLTFNGMV
ncbi:MAG: hypothetical protein K9K21_11875 [Desulfotignum sp.]|nr:hypothetical protein [Desulfotignum sp.]